MHPLAKLDHRYLWHPFTQMRDWLKHEPIVIVEGQGALLRDVHGREYLDANSSIWTNLHGHNNPRINAAIQRQLRKIAHSSALGFANESASLLAEKLVAAANPANGVQASHRQVQRTSAPAQPVLRKVFFSDDGSTAVEVALKLAYESARRTGRSAKPKFLSLEGAYHGDTVGAVALGHIDLFHKAYSGLLFKSDHVMAPYCYRCPFNRARPERADARDYRKCNWECLGKLEQKFSAQKRKGNSYATFVFEPLMQGAAGMIPQPVGWLRRAAEIARAHGALLIADEVMTGFGRTGVSSPSATDPHLNPPSRSSHPPHSTDAPRPTPLFACHHEGIQPDFMAVAKGLTGGYLPMAATLTTQPVFDAFLGEYEDFRTFFHGHSFTANQLGASAALTSLDILQSPASIRARRRLGQTLHDALQALWQSPCVGDIRQVGLVAGIELVRDWRTREPFELRERAGIRVCEALTKLGVLTRSIGNVIVLMPPYCTTPDQVRRMVAALSQALEVLSKK
jgi:adenosylmethionine-8-amino-7-oxononanoate aminotransferase